MTRLEVATTEDAAGRYEDLSTDLHRIDGVLGSQSVSPNLGILTVDPTKIAAVRAEVERLSEGCLTAQVIVE